MTQNDVERRQSSTPIGFWLVLTALVLLLLMVTWFTIASRNAELSSEQTAPMQKQATPAR